jgi:hypothetical protein
MNRPQSLSGQLCSIRITRVDRKADAMCPGVLMMPECVDFIAA